MTIMVSACLLGENCKYNGGNNFSEIVHAFTAGHTVIPVCPEQLGGLPTPRLSAEIRDGIVINRAGESVDAQFRAGAAAALALAQRTQPDLIILQSRSPSCGVGQIYDGTFSRTLVPGMGITAELLAANGFCVLGADKLLPAGESFLR